MNNNYTALPDGSLLFDVSPDIVSNYYYLDPDNNKRVIPKIPVCSARRIELRTLPCGRNRGDWKCGIQADKGISPKDCYECKICPQS